MLKTIAIILTMTLGACSSIDAARTLNADTKRCEAIGNNPSICHSGWKKTMTVTPNKNGTYTVREK